MWRFSASSACSAMDWVASAAILALSRVTAASAERLETSFFSFSSCSERAVSWAREHGLELAGSSYERYVIDIYTSDEQDEYVTEILLPVVCDNDEFNYLEQG